MPYIPQKNRDELLTRNADNAGELNFQFTQIALQYLKDKGMNYNNINDIVGALVCCQHEFIRRKVNDYEDTKIALNGDVE